MKKIIVSLVSEQTVPNMLLIKNNLDADNFLFITTKKMEEKQKIKNICNALDLPESKIEKIVVDQDNTNDIREKLFNNKFDFTNSNYIVNITGGNKLMSLVAYDYFTSKNCNVYYLNLGQNQFQCLYPEYGEVPKTSNLLTLDEYIKSYGIEIKSGKVEYSPGFNINFKDNIYTRHKKSISSLVKIQNMPEFKKKYKDKTKNIDDISEYDKELTTDDIRLLQEVCGFEKLTYKSIRHITGGWFEEYIYQSLKNATQNCIPENDIKINVKILNDKEETLHEIDVIFLYKNDIHIVECKTSVDKSFIKETIYKQRAIKNDFGLTAKSYLFCMENIDDSTKERAKDNNITVRAGLGGLYDGDRFLDNFGNLFKD